MTNGSQVGLAFVTEGFSEWLSSLGSANEAMSMTASIAIEAANSFDRLGDAAPTDASGFDDMASGAGDLDSAAKDAATSVGKVGSEAQNSASGFSGLSEIAVGALREIGAKAVEIGMNLGKDAIGAVGDFISGSIAEASEFQSVFAQTEAVIASTGGAAGITAEDMATLAENMSATAGASIFSDDAILGAQNLLATFTNIKEDVFADATLAITNMSQAMGTDLSSSAMTVGKALNDPIAGLSALGRAGVQFTADQEAQIKAMVAAGDAMGAQKIILGELENQFGGSAAAAVDTFAGQQAVLSEQFAGMQQELGEAIIPLIMQLMIAIQPMIPVFASLISQIASFLGTLDLTPITTFISGLMNSGPAITSTFSTIAEFFKPIIDQIIIATNLLIPVLSEIGAAITEAFFSPAVQTALAGIRDLVTVVMGYLITDMQMLYETFKIVWPYIETVLSSMMNVFNAVIPFVTGLISGLTLLLKGDFAGAWEVVQNAWTTFLPKITEALTKAFGDAERFLNEMVDKFKEIGGNIVQGIANGISAGASKVADAAKNAASAAYEAAKSFLGIESPSKLMRQKIGSQISRGMSLGITDGIPFINRAITTASQAAYANGNIGSNSIVNNNGAVTNNYNLGITTTASPSLIAQSFDIERSLV